MKAEIADGRDKAKRQVLSISRRRLLLLVKQVPDYSTLPYGVLPGVPRHGIPTVPSEYDENLPGELP